MLHNNVLSGECFLITDGTSFEVHVTFLTVGDRHTLSLNLFLKKLEAIGTIQNNSHLYCNQLSMYLLHCEFSICQC